MPSWAWLTVNFICRGCGESYCGSPGFLSSDMLFEVFTSRFSCTGTIRYESPLLGLPLIGYQGTKTLYGGDEPSAERTI